jgi:hypothetical protein
MLHRKFALYRLAESRKKEERVLDEYVLSRYRYRTTDHRETLVETACRLCSCSSMRIIYCFSIQLGGEISNCTGFLPPYSFPLPIPSSLPFSLSVLGGCQILTLEAPLITEKAPCMYYGYIYSKDDVRSPFVKPPCYRYLRYRKRCTYRYRYYVDRQRCRVETLPIHRV